MTYTGSTDKTEVEDLKSAYKLIDLILEDFDTDGNVRIGFIRLIDRSFSLDGLPLLEKEMFDDLHNP